MLAEDEHASLVDLGDRVACIEFHTKANIVSEGVLAFIEETLAERAGADYDALVIGNQGSHFSGGADLKMMVDKISAEDWDGIDATLRNAQRASMALKYAPIPVVAAPFGRVLGGGLEVCLHCSRVQAHTDVSMGLVETSVGLVPAAGGIKETRRPRHGGARRRGHHVPDPAQAVGGHHDGQDVALRARRRRDGLPARRRRHHDEPRRA